MKIDRLVLVKKLQKEGYSEEEAEALIGDGEFHQVDGNKKVVMGECSHYFEVDEPGEAIRHVVCNKCGFGTYTNKQVENGSIKSVDD